MIALPFAIPGFIKAIGAFLRSIPWPVWGAIALLLAVAWFGHVRYEAGQLEVQVRWDHERAQHAELAERQRLVAKAARQARIDRGRQILKQLKRGNSDGKAQVDGLVAGVRDGTVRVLPRFTCPAIPAAAARAGAGGSDASSPRGLSAADAEFLVRFAGDADDVARQLAACQAVVAADRAQFAMPSKLTVSDTH